MAQGIFVIGTDTDVGKTFISCSLAAVMKDSGMDIGVFKPMMSGMSRENPQSDPSLLKQMAQDSNDLASINPFQFDERVTPYIAAKRVNQQITLQEVTQAWEDLSSTHDYFVVEGAGGLMAPLGKGYHVGDLAQAIGLPVVIVARAGLGTVNHTLLTIEKLRALGLTIRGVIMNGFRQESGHVVEQTNRGLIEEFGQVPVIGEVPQLQVTSRDDHIKLARKWIDWERLL